MPIPILDEIISYGKVFLGLASHLWRWTQRNKRKLTPKERLEQRAKWKPQVEAWLLEHEREKLRNDCIIRDMRRMDNYPDTKEAKGISAWFRVSLIDTYEKGIMVWLRIEALSGRTTAGGLATMKPKKTAW
jgi:hypothetical protein